MFFLGPSLGMSHCSWTATCHPRGGRTDYQVHFISLPVSYSYFCFLHSVFSLLGVHRCKCAALINVFWSLCRGWLERESRHGLQPGDYWFLISTQWWQQWKDYVKYVSLNNIGCSPKSSPSLMWTFRQLLLSFISITFELFVTVVCTYAYFIVL